MIPLLCIDCGEHLGWITSEPVEYQQCDKCYETEKLEKEVKEQAIADLTFKLLTISRLAQEANLKHCAGKRVQKEMNLIDQLLEEAAEQDVIINEEEDK